jgi:hypothetical protein
LEAVSKVPGLGGAAGLADTYRQSADQMDAASAASFGQAGDLLSGPLAEAQARIAQSMDNALTAMSSAMEAAGETIDTSGLEAARDGIVSTISEQMKANEEAARARFEASKTMIPGMDGEGMAGGKSSNTGIIAQSLQKVGGGAAFARFSDAANPAAQQLREQQKSNGFLARIEQKLTPQMALMPA